MSKTLHHNSHQSKSSSTNHSILNSNHNLIQLPLKKHIKRLTYGPNYIPEEETIRNDYSLNYLLTGARPQNFIHNTALETRFIEYPKLKKLIQLKHQIVNSLSHPPTYLQADLRSTNSNYFNLIHLHPARFDVIILDPPIFNDHHNFLSSNHHHQSNQSNQSNHHHQNWSWEELSNLPLPQIAASPGFIFLWCGSGQGTNLEQGRALLSKWGYRKCEDLVWVKTNHLSINKSKSNLNSKNPSIFTPTKEHCLMGIRGTVRRSTDGHFVHCNVDTDVIVSEPDPNDPSHKPKELYNLIENFCLGRRRLELFGSRRSLRPGWLTIGTDCAPKPLEDLDSIPLPQRPVPYSNSAYLAHFLDSAGRTQNLLPSNPEIENLRPRSPPGRITPTLSGLSIPPGLGLGYPTHHGIPIIGANGTILATTTSGRNTLSHPSGGLGRGPGNALLPGMRVSGFRESNSSRISRSFNPSNQFNQPNLTYSHSQIPYTHQPLPSTHQLHPQPNWSPYSHQNIYNPILSNLQPFPQPYPSQYSNFLSQPIPSSTQLPPYIDPHYFYNHPNPNSYHYHQAPYPSAPGPQ